jgi:TorA maturation chaperone TorD
MSSDSQPVAGRDEAVRRANAYHALAQALSPPAEWEPTFPQLLRDGLLPLGGELEKPAGELATVAEAAMKRKKRLAVMHARLFVGPFEILAAPWASLYLDPNQRLMGDTSQYAIQAYAEAGLGPSSSRKEAPDHITHELEFMYYLAFQEGTTGETSWRERQRRFWNEHLGRWLPKLAQAVRNAKLDSYYGALAGLLCAFANAENAHLGVAVTSEDSELPRDPE